MKKVMMVTALAALAAGAMAEDVVPSGNIVGYAKLKLESNPTMAFGAIFKDIPSAQKDLKIQEIKTASGAYNANITWWTGWAWDQATWNGAIWEDDDFDPCDKTFFVGEGFRLTAGVGDFVTVQGELYTASSEVVDIALSLQSNPTEFFVNPMPVELDILDIETTSGAYNATITWWTGWAWEKATWNGSTWEDDDFAPSDKTFLVGEGFRFTGNVGDKLFVPNPLYVP